MTADGRRRPFWLRWLWAPGVAWLIYTMIWAMSVKRVAHVDSYVLTALTWAFLGIIAWAVLSLIHLHTHRPSGLAKVKTVANAFVVVYWADKAVHAAVRHYGDDDHDHD